MDKTVDIDNVRYVNAVNAFKRGAFASCIETFLELSSRGNARATLYAATVFDRGGRGVDCDWGRARSLYEQSLSQAYLPGAAFGLAMMHYYGRGGPSSHDEAQRLLKMLHRNAYAEIMLGVISLTGDVRAGDEENSLSHFDRAWALGHPLGLKNASIIRFKRGQYVRAACGFVYGACLIFWYYGVRRLPIVKSPIDDRFSHGRIEA